MSRIILTSDTEVVSKAYITLVDSSFIKDEVIDVAQDTYIRPILGDALFADVLANQSNYTTLIADYIKPCIAFYVKYLIYSQQVFASAEYNDPDPTTSEALVTPDVASNIDTKMHYLALNDILFIARQKAKILSDYLTNNPPALYEPPTKKRISGFLLQASS